MKNRFLAALVAAAMLMLELLACVPAMALDAGRPIQSAEEPGGRGVYTVMQDWSFESQDEFDEWSLVDADGDGYNWKWLAQGINYFDLTGNPAYDGVGVISSSSTEGLFGVHPDNWIISPAIELPYEQCRLTFKARALVMNYLGENFAVYAGSSDNVAEMTQIVPETAAGAEYVELTASLSPWAGGTVYIAFRNFNSGSAHGVAIDMVEVWNKVGSEPDETPEPTATPGPTETPEPTESPLPTEEPGGPIVSFCFESQAEANEWTLIDADGDGRNWSWLGYMINFFDILNGNPAYEGIGVMSSASVGDFNAPLTPDNWMISPAIELPAGGAELTFWVRAKARGNVGEIFAVYAGPSPDINSMECVVPATETTSEYVQISADLGDYAGGTVYIAFRNYSSTGKGGIVLDQAEVWNTEPPVQTVYGVAQGWYFESQAEFDLWSLLDADGDSYEWVWYGFGVNYTNLTYGSYAYEGIGVAYSFSSRFNDSLTPDNWMISPAVQLPEGETELTFYVRAATPIYPGAHFAVYAGTSPETESMECIVAETEAEAEYQRIAVDLSDWSGETVYIAFRNFDSVGIFGVVVDKVEVWGNIPEPGEPEFTELDAALNIEGGTLHFENDMGIPWYVEEADGRTYAKAGNSGHLQIYASTVSTVRTTVTVAEGSVVRFDYRARGWMNEPFWVHCSFAVDDEVLLDVGDLGPLWREFTCELPEGTHTLVWRFSKFAYNVLPPNVEQPESTFMLDNVFVGPEPHAEQISATESMDIQVNRAGQIDWTVLPMEAVDKDVVFSVDDPTVASVDDEGYVFGLSEGDTFVTTALASDHSIYAVTNVHVTDTGLDYVTIYGRVGGNFEQLGDKLVSIYDFDPGKINVIGDLPPAATGLAYAYGKLFGFTGEGVFYTINMASFETYYPRGNVTTEYDIQSLTYDYTRDMLFGIGALGLNSEYKFLVSIEPTSGEVTEIGRLFDYSLAIAADGEGTGWLILDTGELCTVSLDSAECSVVGSTGLYPRTARQDICCDIDSGELYWAYLANDGKSVLYRVDKQTAEAENLGRIGRMGVQLFGMFIIPENEPDGSAVTAISVSTGSLYLEPGRTAQISAYVRPFSAENKDVVWSVDDESVAVVDQNGNVTGLNRGRAVVTATSADGGFTASAVITVGTRVVMFDFEKIEEIQGLWGAHDGNGDGYTWRWRFTGEPGKYDTPGVPYEGMGVTFDLSYEPTGGYGLNPDDWLISPAIELPNAEVELTLFALGQHPGRSEEHFVIYAGTSPSPSQMVPVSEEYVTTDAYARYSADLSAFAGQTVYIAIRHYKSFGQYALCIDNIELWQVADPSDDAEMGDVNHDGVVDLSDALALLRHCMELVELPEEWLPVCDVDRNGILDLLDVLMIMRYSMGLIPEI